MDPRGGQGMTHVDPVLSYVAKKTGIELSRGGLLTALEAYVEHRMRELHLHAKSDYVRLLQSAEQSELERLIEIVSVPHTWFFRDLEQMDAVRQALTHLDQPRHPLRIWVPACATGEDAYSLALLVHQAGHQARIVGSDLCARSLQFARRGRYSRFSLRDLPEPYLQHFAQEQRDWVLDERIKRLVEFRSHNLLEPALAVNDGWDLILCRNVLIYFSPETGLACAERLAHSLHPRGMLAFGAGELIGQLPPGLHSQLLNGRVFFSRAGHEKTPRHPAAKAAVPPPAVSPPRAAWAPPPAPLPVARPTPLPPPSNEAIAAAASALLSADPPSAIADRVMKHSTDNPLEPMLRLITGVALYTAGDFGHSQNELRAALLLDDQLWPAALYRGLCLESMGKPVLARSEYAHVARLLRDPDRTSPCLPGGLKALETDLLELARIKTRGLFHAAKS